MKIAICTPHYAGVAATYAKSLAKMLVWTSSSTIVFNGVPTIPQFEVFMWSSSILPMARNQIARDAIEWGANYLLWIDGDHAFPEDALLHLLSHNLPIVGANYLRRDVPPTPTTTALDASLVWTTEELAERQEVVEVDSLGLGFCLVDANVIRTMPKPLFAIEMLGDGTQATGEDVFFFRRAREAGFKSFVDHAVSWHIGHIHEQLIMNSDGKPPLPAQQP